MVNVEIHNKRIDHTLSLIVRFEVSFFPMFVNRESFCHKTT